ncbi:hypothetical protein TNCT_113461 [Trichonephila clavata]|uniref:Uncharacterized protein n=1 Tax=Trichonephila clavata TaxID=2740835 RepID=A0A8X6FCD6_TRICU|nr:hypothetical protein TNCT_113461 [Trichonephila clavata]
MEANLSVSRAQMDTEFPPLLSQTAHDADTDSVIMEDSPSADPQAHYRLNEREKDAGIVEIRTGLATHVIAEEKKTPSTDPVVSQGYEAEKKPTVDSKKFIHGELTYLTPFPVKDCLHNATVKSKETLSCWLCFKVGHS